MLKLRKAAVERFKLGLRQILHLGVGEHGREVLTLGAGLPQLGDGLRDGFQLGVFLRHLSEGVSLHLTTGQGIPQLVVTRRDAVEHILETHRPSPSNGPGTGTTSIRSFISEPFTSGSSSRNSRRSSCSASTCSISCAAAIARNTCDGW